MQTKHYPGLVVNASLLFILFKLTVFSQITVNINSGNPAFPFPQFLAYDNPTQKLDNLATHNPPGLCHAEMEQSIRDAYQIMMNRASKTGVQLNGIYYILYKSSPDCSEGDGYAMLAAAAMADKTTFDGLWLWVHDNAMNKVTSYSTGQAAPVYNYSTLPGWTNTAGANSAADGDADIALALYTAYQQWGQFMGINDSRGNPISYKHDLIEFLKGMTDTIPFYANPATYDCGDIGMDGYIKSGDTWSELTNWASDTSRSGFLKTPNFAGPAQQYIDYAAPSYFHEFADFLSKEDPSLYAWNIQQFQRCEASSDWLMGQLLANPKNIPFAGHVSLTADSVAAFTQASEGEDFRLGWRTILNYVWHGNPTATWGPVSHQITSGASNSFERDIGQRYARFLWDARQSPWNNPCISNGNTTFTYWGPSAIVNNYTVTGGRTGSFFLNWVPGTGSPSAIISQDFNLMAELYRYCEIEWDVETLGDGYLTSVPMYFSDWFRLFGMLVLSGNYYAPSAIKPGANMKVYLDVDKTCAAKDEEITYTISYRNYGSLDAQDVAIIDTLPEDFLFVSCTGAAYVQSSAHIVTWEIGTVPGFKTASGTGPTAGEISLKVSLDKTTLKQYANKASISCSNGLGWTSNECPNRVSSVMKRTYVDVINPPQVIDTSVSQISPLHGGRSGVHVSFSHDATYNPAPSQTMRIRLFHDAQEPYINYGNYRVSYFLYDTAVTGIQGQNGNTTGWYITPVLIQGIKNLTMLYQKLTPGSDVHGKWNQRIVFQFSGTPDPDSSGTMATITKHLETYEGEGTRIHRGQKYPLVLEWMLNASDWHSIQWGDDWSWDSAAVATDADAGFPITPDFTDPAPTNQGIPVTTLNPKHCETAAKTVDNILVEEWDGYTWRQVFGNSPADLTTASKHMAFPQNPLSIVSLCRSKVEYVLPRPENVRIKILDMRGRTVAVLLDSFQKAGPHSIKWDRNKFVSDVYFLRLESGKGSVSRKFVSMN